MMNLFYLFIILSQIVNAYGMDINRDWRNNPELLRSDDLESIDLNSETESHGHNNTCLIDLTAQNDQDNADIGNTVRTVPWKILLSQYDIFNHSPAKRAIVLKTIKYFDTSLLFYDLPYRSPSSLSRESEPDLVTRELIQLIQDICLHEPEHNAQAVYSDQGRALFLGKRKSLPHSLKPEYNARNNSTASNSSSN